MHLYDRFIGRWEAEAQAFLPDGTSRRHYWRIRFERVLEGRALLRWIFADLRPDQFRWRAELSRDEGARWHKAIEMLAYRAKEP